MEWETHGVLSFLVILLGGTGEKGEVFSLTFFFSSLTSTHIPRDWEQLLLPPCIMKNYNLEYLWYIQDSSICQKNPGGQDTDSIAPSLLLFPEPLPELPPPQSSLTTHSAVPTCTMYLHALMKKAQLGDS